MRRKKNKYDSASTGSTSSADIAVKGGGLTHQVQIALVSRFPPRWVCPLRGQSTRPVLGESMVYVHRDPVDGDALCSDGATAAT